MMQENLVTELSMDEIDAVSGAGLFGSIIGSSLQAAVDLSNGVLNAVAPIGLALNTIPGISPIHKLGDQTIFSIQGAVNKIGSLLGGRYTPVNPNHYQQEWPGA